MADFATLGLVTPSTKKKPIADQGEYWTLTEQGKKVLSFIRLLVLEMPLREAEEIGTQDVVAPPETEEEKGPL